MPADWLDELAGKVAAAAAERAAGPYRAAHLEFAVAMQDEATRLIEIAKAARRVADASPTEGQPCPCDGCTAMEALRKALEGAK